MIQHDYLPKACEALLTWLLNFLGYLKENLQRFKITEDYVLELETKINEYQQACIKASHPNAGKADRLERREKANALSRIVRKFVNEFLRYNREVTDEDRVLLGLHIADTKPTHSEVLPTWPVAYARTIGPRMVRVEYHDSASTSKAKPAGMHGAEIRHAILTAPPTSTEELLHSDFSTRTPYLFTFEENQRGQSVYFCLRWENTRGKKGPWGEILHTIIP